MLTAKCHCGNVELTATKLPESLNSCQCSVCYRYGTLWAYYKPEEVDITFNTEPTKTYSWLDKVIDFHHCPVCGCLTHYTSTDKTDWECTAINARMAGPDVVSTIPIRESEGP